MYRKIYSHANSIRVLMISGRVAIEKSQHFLSYSTSRALGDERHRYGNARPGKLGGLTQWRLMVTTVVNDVRVSTSQSNSA